VTESPEKTRIESYLLGELSYEERETLEERFFIDDDFFADVEAAEMELIDRYVRNEMSDIERRTMEQNYLITPERKQKVADAAAFHKEINTLRVPTIIEDNTKVSWFEKLFGGFSLSAMQLGATAAIAILALSVGWLLYDSNRLRNEVLVARNERSETEGALNEKLRQKEQELQEKSQAQNSDSETVGALEDEIERLKGELNEERKKPTLSKTQESAPTTPLVATVMLIGTRGGNLPTQIMLAPETKILNLRIPINPDDGKEFEVKVTGDSGVLVDSNKIVPRAIKGGRILSVNIPADKLHEGFYQVLTRNEEGEERTRSFVIKPK
jgi:hypothetical protein